MDSILDEYTKMVHKKMKTEITKNIIKLWKVMKSCLELEKYTKKIPK